MRYWARNGPAGTVYRKPLHELRVTCYALDHHVSRFTIQLTLLLSSVGTYIGQEGHVSGALDGGAEAALVTGAGPGLAARFDLAALGEVAAQARHVLVIDLLHAVYAEGAYLAARD